MRRMVVPGLALLIAVALIALLAFGVAHQGTSSSLDAQVAHGKRPPVPKVTLALPVLGGTGSKSLASFRGKVVVLNVWASWCQPCQVEAPLLEREQRRLVAGGGTVLGVTYLDNSLDSESFVHKYHVTYPSLRDIGGDFVRSFGTTGVPETFVIDRSGRIAAIRRYQVDSGWLAKTLPPLLAERT